MNYLQSPETNSHQIANQLLNDGRHSESKKILAEILREDPSDHVAIHLLGSLAKETKQFQAEVKEILDLMVLVMVVQLEQLLRVQ